LHRWRQTVWSSRGGVGNTTLERERSAIPGRVFSAPALSHAERQRLLAAFVHLHSPGKAAYLSEAPAEKAKIPLESVPAYQPPPPDPPHEPILTLPGALTAYVGLIAFVHLRVLLPPEAENWTIDVFGFIPRRYDPNPLQIYFPGGAGAKVWTFVTYSLLHANLSHIFFNVLWLLPFGSALARRFGAVRFYVFMAVTAAAGALAHLVTHEHAVAPMIGASASVSGTMAAAVRFSFVQGGFLWFSRGDAGGAAEVPALSPGRVAPGSPRRGVLGRLVRRQHHVRRRIAGARHRRRGGRLAGAYRRLFRGPVVIFPVRSDPARQHRCCNCVVGSVESRIASWLAAPADLIHHRSLKKEWRKPVGVQMSGAPARPNQTDVKLLIENSGKRGGARSFRARSAIGRRQ